MGSHFNSRAKHRGGTTRWGNILRITLAFPALIAALCLAAMLAEPATARAAASQTIQTTKVALSMYFRTVVTSQGGPSGAVATQSNAFADGSAANSFTAQADAVSPPDQAHSSAFVDGGGFDLTSTITRQSGTGDQASGQFSVDFWVDAPLAYTFGGSFSSSSALATAGSFTVTLDDLGAGTELFSHLDSTIPPGFSTTITDKNSTGGLSGQFLPDTTYRLTVNSELDDDGVSGLPAVQDGAHVTVAFIDVPEPGSVALLFAGCGSLLSRRKRLR